MQAHAITMRVQGVRGKSSTEKFNLSSGELQKRTFV